MKPHKQKKPKPSQSFTYCSIAHLTTATTKWLIDRESQSTIICRFQSCLEGWSSLAYSAWKWQLKSIYYIYICCTVQVLVCTINRHSSIREIPPVVKINMRVNFSQISKYLPLFFGVGGNPKKVSDVLDIHKSFSLIRFTYSEV